MLGKKIEGIMLKLSTLFDIAPDQEMESLISAEKIKQKILRGLIHLGHSRYERKLKEYLRKNKKNPACINNTTPSNSASDPTPLSPSLINSPLGSSKRLTRGTADGMKHQAFGQKRHFSLSRDKTNREGFLSLGYPGLHIWRIVHQLSQGGAHQVTPSGGFSTMHQIGILSTDRTIYQRSSPQLVKRTTLQAVPGYGLRCSVRLTHLAIKKFVCVCPPRNCPSRNFVRLLGILLWRSRG